MKIRCDGTRRNNRHNFRAVHTNKDKPSRRRRALFQLEKKKVEKILHLLVIERGGSGEGNANTKRADRRRSKIFGQRKMWPDLLEQMLSTGQQGRRAANSYVYTKSMGHTRASNRHTTPPTHTGALSYPRECVCVAGWLAWLGAYVFTGGSSRQCQRVALASTGVVVTQRLDLFRFFYPSDASEAGGPRGACAGPGRLIFWCLYSLLSNAHVERRRQCALLRANPTLKKHNGKAESDFRCFHNYLFKSFLARDSISGLGLYVTS
jgi:hypothetical protein